MSEIIQFPRTRDGIYSPPQVDFLRKCRGVLSEEDYQDLLEAIETVDGYRNADDDIKALVRAYEEV